MKIGPIILLVWFLLVISSAITAIVLAVVRCLTGVRRRSQATALQNGLRPSCHRTGVSRFRECRSFDAASGLLRPLHHDTRALTTCLRSGTRKPTRCSSAVLRATLTPRSRLTQTPGFSIVCPGGMDMTCIRSWP